MLDNTSARLSVIVEKNVDKYNRPEGDENAEWNFTDDGAVP